MTNADCIRRMSDEQLYEFLSEWECGDIDYAVTFCDLCNEATKRGEVGNVLNLDCDGCRKHWLQRDAVDYGGLMYWKRNTTFTADTPQTEDDYFLELMDAVKRGEMSDASANQAYYEYIDKQAEEADTTQTDCGAKKRDDNVETD